jgi:hypothetical protein
VRSRDEVGSDIGRGIGPWEWTKEGTEKLGSADAYGKKFS